MDILGENDMSALLFVHGTGVRRPAYDETLTLLRNGFGGIDADIQVHECYWGDGFGIPAGVGGAALPGAALPGGALPGAAAAEASGDDPGIELVPADELTQDDQDAIVWGTLYEDPLSALRRPDTAEDDLGGLGGLMFGDPTAPDVEAKTRALAHAPPPALERLLAAVGVRPEEFEAALTAVLDSATGQDAPTRGLGPGELPTAVATAAVALLLSGIVRQGRPPLWTTAQRDEAVRIIVGELGGESKGLGGKVLFTSWKAARRFGVMRLADRNRAQLMAGVHPQLGDILKYLARGHELRTFIQKCVAETVRAHGPDADLWIEAHPEFTDQHGPLRSCTSPEPAPTRP
jgi:hypothetical protein